MFAHSYDSTRNDCVEALSVFERLQETLDNRLKPNLTSYNIAMSCYSKLRYLKHLEKLFDDLLDAGISPSVETYNCLMLAYQRLGFWWRMEEVFCEMQKGSLKANELTFKTLVRGYATAGLLDRMENAYEAMLNHGYHARATTTDSMIAAYKKAGEFAKMEAILFSMRAKRRQKQISKLMIKGHACGGRIESMELLLDEMMRNGDVDFSPQLATIIVKAYFKKGEHGKIKDFVVTAEQHKWNLNRSFFNTLIYLYAKEEEHAEMKWHFGRMIASGCLPNDRTFQIMYRTYL
ncbi:hypothetical protein KP509_04G059100 [Ceratopteris richardii]|nr:hypothetical protein KP509_04G059100 [Ceratopteris richardii]